MLKINVKYNPFWAKTTVTTSEGEAVSLDCIGTGENSRLQEWMYAFFSDLRKRFNLGAGDECLISYYGIAADYDDLGLARDEFCESNPGIRISLELCTPESKTLSARLHRLRDMFERMRDESPYPELKEPTLKSRFDKAVDAEFEMAIIATMSSGKSTLGNALLGLDLLPAKNEATTAKITRIRNIDGVQGWTVRGIEYNEDGNAQIAHERGVASLDAIDALNGDPVIRIIEIEGDIPGIESRDIQFVLSDTPGPNNSRTADHAVHINELIKDDTYKPMILYILNATQLEINDDKELLEKISNAMQGSGKQSKDRFLFVLNKADALDPGKKEFISDKVSDSKAYLFSKFNIKGANIFPVSARLAQVIRMSQSGVELTEDEEDFLGKKNRFIKNKERHLSDFASLSESNKKKLATSLKAAEEQDDLDEQALIHSGIKALELAINEYLEKYALAAKIHQAVEVFRAVVEKLNLANETQKALAQDQSKRLEVVSTLQKLQAELDSGDQAVKLKEKFDGDIVSIKAELANSFEHYETEVDGKGREERAKYMPDEDASKGKPKQLSPKDVEKLLDGTARKLAKYHEYLSAELQKTIDEKLKQQALSYIEEYKSHVSQLMQAHDAALSDTLNLLGTSIPDNADVLLEQIEGHVEKAIKKWYQPWTWFKGNTVRTKDLFEDAIQPQFRQFTDLINEAKKEADIRSEQAKDYFKQEIDRLDALLKEKACEQQEHLASQDALDKQIALNKEKAEWLKRFIQQLDNFLEI